MGVLSAVVLAVYGLSQTAGVPYGEDAIAVVDFSMLTRQEKRTALQTANREHCTCGCGMSLAQCVATDSTCPLRPGNITKIRTMVDQALSARTSS